MEDHKKTVELPKNVRVVGTYKMKDKRGRDLISFRTGPEVEGVIIQKVKGKSSMIIIAVKMFDKPEGKIEVPTDIKDDQPKETPKS